MPTITIDPKAFAEAIAAVRPALGRSSAIETLRGIRLTSTATGATLAATDMDVFAICALHEYECDGDGELDCVVAHKQLADIARLFRRHRRIGLTFEPSGGRGGDRLICSADRRRIALETLRLEDFPAWPAADERTVLTANGEELAHALERAGQFASKDQTRPLMCSINVDWNDGLVLVGCDSFRLAAIPAPATLKMRRRVESRRQPDPNRVTIGARGLLLAARAMRRSPGVSLCVTDTHAIVHLESTTWAIRLVEGQYPRWRQLIPSEFRHEITIPVSELMEACDLATAFSTNGAPTRLLANGDLKLHGGTRFGPSYEQHLADANVALSEGTTFEIGFNPAFLDGIARAYQSDRAVLRLTSPRRAVVFEDQEDRYLLMPIRLDN